MKTLGFLISLAALSVVAFAQNGPTCSVSIIDSNSNKCQGTEWLPTLTKCEYAKVSCPNFVNNTTTYTFADNYITFGYLNPTGTSLGTVVFFSDGGGETTDGDVVGTSKVYAADYNTAGYQVVQTAWKNDWEDTGTSTKQIAYAAGRPAAFLLWVYNNLFTNSNGAGMCVQGASAGGAAAMYALAWYGQYSFIDKVSLLSAPPIADIEQGCEVLPGLATPSATVCASGQLGCNSHNSPLSWTQDLTYTDALTSVRTWTGLNSCSGSTVTLPADNAAWKAMSIVDGNVATFSYPNTNITTWLCSSVGSPGDNDGPMNNSSPEAQLFLQQFTSSSQIPKGLTINGVGSCETSEEVGPGNPPSNYSGNGTAAIEFDMTQDTSNMCKLNH